MRRAECWTHSETEVESEVSQQTSTDNTTIMMLKLFERMQQQCKTRDARKRKRAVKKKVRDAEKKKRKDWSSIRNGTRKEIGRVGQQMLRGAVRTVPRHIRRRRRKEDDLWSKGPH